jgi:toxin-antitoxin system PIN domain toxin
MTLFFPDLNVWLALSDIGHEHNRDAWNWMSSLPRDARLVFSRYTQLGLLRLLTNTAVMGEATLNLREAWDVYDRWLEDPRVEFYPEPRGADGTFRQLTESFTKQQATKALGDCWLLACASGIDATLVTFDRALYDYSRKQGCLSVTPS